MGIYDRDYYRGEGNAFLSSFVDRGRVCKWLIGLNLLFFIVQLFTRIQTRMSIPGVEESIALPGGWEAGPFTDALILNTDKVLGGQVWRLLTYAFLHDTTMLSHIAFNMLFLWWFGSEIEDLYGPREFLTFYLTAAVLGGVGFVLGVKAGLGFGAKNCLGASGAVMAILVLSACHFPNRIIYFMCLIPIPIWLFVVFEVAQDLYPLLSHNPTTTAVTVHLAGAAFGFVYYKRQWRLMNLVPEVRGWRRRLSQPRLRVYHEEEPPTPVSVATPAPPAEAEEHLEAEMDAILEKISRTGKESLTERERQILVRASEIIKRRRR